MALSLWRRFALAGPEEFGEVYYLGTAPLAGHEGLADVLVGLHGGVECRFYFDSENYQLLSLEMFPAESVDPSEVRFLEYRPQDNVNLPHELEIRFGDQVRELIKLDTIDFRKQAPSDKEGQSP